MTETHTHRHTATVTGERAKTLTYVLETTSVPIVSLIAEPMI